MAKRWRLIGLLSGLVLGSLAVMAPSALAVTGSEVTALTARDSLQRTENPLSNGSKWAALHWATEEPATGAVTTTGWHPTGSSKAAGAYWKTSFSEPNAAMVKMATGPGASGYDALWIDMSAPGTTESGYQLTWVLESGTSYFVKLLKWSAGTQASLGSLTAVTIAAGASLALSDNGSSLTVWESSGGSMTELGTVSDSTYSAGYTGIESGGATSSRLTEFKAGHLVAAPTFSWTAPVSPAASTSPKIAGSAESGSTVKIYTSSGCTGEPVASGTAAAFASPGIATTVTKNTTTSYYATATDSSGDVSPCSTTHGTYENDASEILFEGATLSNFKLLQQCVAGRISEVADPLGSGKTVMSFEPHDTDVAKNPECGEKAAPTEDPRANALSPNFIEPGDEFWLRERFLIPTSLAELHGSAWMALMQIYGGPATEVAPWSTEIKPVEVEGTYYGDALMHQRNGDYKFDIGWFGGFTRGAWTEVLLHEKFAEKGWVEEWLNGEQEEFFAPETTLWNPLGEPQVKKLEMATLDSGNDGEANSVRIGQYRHEEEFTPAPTYFEFVKVGKTKASVGS